MPIERDKWYTDLKFYYAVINDDGTYGEPILFEGCKTIEIEWEDIQND